YQWIDVEADADARRLVQLAGAGPAQLPLVLFPEGATLIQPTIVQLAERLGLRMRAERPSYDLVIVGGGPAGLAAAVYGASEGLRTLLVEREAPGGQAGTTSRIENYLGFPSGLSGADLTRRAVAQAAMYLSKFARDVTILVRGPSLADSMSQYLIAQIDETENVAVRTRASVVEVLGETHLEAIRVSDAAAGTVETVPADALFIYI